MKQEKDVHAVVETKRHSLGCYIAKEKPSEYRNTVSDWRIWKRKELFMPGNRNFTLQGKIGDIVEKGSVLRWLEMYV